jgi:hypothetical protein
LDVPLILRGPRGGPIWRWGKGSRHAPDVLKGESWAGFRGGDFHPLRVRYASPKVPRAATALVQPVIRNGPRRASLNSDPATSTSAPLPPSGDQVNRDGRTQALSWPQILAKLLPNRASTGVTVFRCLPPSQPRVLGNGRRVPSPSCSKVGFFDDAKTLGATLLCRLSYTTRQQQGRAYWPRLTQQ